MQDDSQDKLAAGVWEMLAHRQVSEISLAMVADEVGLSPQAAILAVGDVTGAILHQLDLLDRKALSVSVADFADDPMASIYDKLLEGLMMRFEILAPDRSQFEALHQASKKMPVLAAHLLHQLSDTVGKLLVLAGDDSSGLLKQARIIGVVGVLLRVRPVWASDEGADLGLTLKKLDKDLKRACEWAVSLRVLSQDDIGSIRDE